MIPNHPSQIRFRWIEYDLFPGEYARRTYWTPFQAACLLLDMLPGPVEGDGTVSVGREPDSRRDESYEDDPANDALAEDLIKLTDTLNSNWRGVADAPAQDIVRWAVQNFVIPLRSFWANRLLPENAPAEEAPLGPSGAGDETRPDEGPRDRRGARASDRRQHILGAALRALASEAVWKKTVKGGEITASELAKHIDDCGHQYRIPDEASGKAYGYSHENIVKTVRDALSLAQAPDPAE